MKTKRVIILALFILSFFVSSVFADESGKLVTAKVIDAGEVYEQEVMEYTIKVQDVKLEVLEGEFKGEILKSTYNVSYDLDGKLEGYPLNNGNKVGIQISTEDGEIKDVIVQDIIRQDYIILMIIVFFALIIAIGKIQGVKAIISLILTIIGIFGVMLPAIINGMSPILISILVSVGIIVLSFLIISGVNKKAITAALGTSGGVIFAGIMAAIFGIMAKLSGAQEEALYLSMNTQNIIFNYRELLFAGIVIAALGACMDVGMSIASALDELKQKNPEMSKKDIIKSGMNIGRDVIGTMTNTLILAYVGGALSLVLLYMVNNMSISDIFNTERIATDAISSIAASMGVVFTVPITAAVYSLLSGHTIITHKTVNKEDGRSLKL